MIRAGARYEDDVLALPPRPLNHFFDPATGGALRIDPLQYVGILPASVVLLIATANATNQASPDWALDSTLVNGYSRRNLSTFMQDAYLRPLKSQRDAAVGRMFETVGRLVHHVQDMAQPQHVRNDAHLHAELLEDMCPTPPNPGLEDPMCPLYRKLRAPSSYELWTRALPVEALPVAGYSAAYDASDRATFSQPRRFWTHDGKGLAEFTNRNFYSAGTMNRSPPTTGPHFDVLASDLCAGIAVLPCEIAHLDHTVRFFPSAVDDRLRPGTSGPNPYAAAESIYSADFSRIVGGPPVRTVNRFTFQHAHAYLLPRAVGYSAGLINYLFRGEINVRPPAEGVYALVDTSATGCGNPCGFRKLKLELQNATPGDEAMGPGVLHVVVKYHRNRCFQPDLSGHFGAPGFTGNACRAEEGVSVSAPIALDGPVARGGAWDAHAFDFVSLAPIPIDATDVRLQVVFRGRLGAEDDAVAVTTVDIAEPNFVAVANNTDYYFDSTENRYLPSTASIYPYVLDTVKLWFADPATRPAPIASLAPLGAGQHAQFAFLGEKSSVRYWLRDTTQYVSYRDIEDEAFPVQEFVLDETAAAPIYRTNCPVRLARGMYRQHVRMYIRDGQGSRMSSGQATSAKPGTGEAPLKLAALNCQEWVAPGEGGISDFSTLVPQFTPADAARWAVNF